MTVDASARCAKHPTAAAVDTCQRCGAFVCGECVQIRAEDVYCGDCVKLLDKPASGRPAAALTIAFLAGPTSFGLAIIAPLATIVGAPIFFCATVIALSLLLNERRARARGQVSAKGPTYALAWAMLGLDGLAVLAFVAALVYAGSQP